MGSRVRYMLHPEEGEIACPHCEAIVDVPMILEPLHPLELDADGFNRDWVLQTGTMADYHPHFTCDGCQREIVLGSDDGQSIYAVRGRSATDLRYLAMKENT